MSKYPYIPDKRMFAAVMGACSYIRETGYFNKAVSFYAEKYHVDEKELADHIRARQAAGQKGRASASKGRKFKWFFVCETIATDADPVPTYNSPQIVRGLTPQTVEHRYTENDFYRTMKADYGGNYAEQYSHVVIASFDSKKEAEKYLPSWREFLPRKD